MTHTRTGILVAILAVGATAASSGAVAADLSGAYLGANFGRARNSYDTGFVDGQVAGSAAESGDTVDFTDRSIQRMSDAWWVNAGYFFTPYIGLDAAFMHVGEIKYIAVGTLSGLISSQPIVSDTEVSSHGPALSLIGRLPLTENFAVDLRVGDYFGKAVFNNSIAVGANSASSSDSKAASSLLAGIGASYTVAGHWSARIDYLRVNKTGNSDVGKFSVNLATAGLSYTF
jgi:opacity protein-like surface antigen